MSDKPWNKRDRDDDDDDDRPRRRREDDEDEDDRPRSRRRRDDDDEEEERPRRRRRDDDDEDEPPRKVKSKPRTGEGGNRAKLKELQGILAFVGLLTVAVNLYDLSTFDKQIADARAQGARISDQLVKQGKMLDVMAIAVGAAFVGLAVFVYKAPLVCTISALALFLLMNFATLMVLPELLAVGFIWKIIVFIAIVKGIQAAAAFEADPEPEPKPLRSVPPRSESVPDEFPGFGPGR